MDISLDEYKEKLDKVLTERFGLTAYDCMDDYGIVCVWENNETPEEVADWYKEKYDLTELNDRRY